ncbi:hypothetical protein FDECE_15076 [Fusarium decemcellulare]|nr:hypothetical protein FDECE_15076 [Fusarium decemcellulare]
MCILHLASPSFSTSALVWSTLVFYADPLPPSSSSAALRSYRGFSGFACGIQQQAEHGPGCGLLITPYQPLPDLVDCGVCKCEFMSPWSDLVAPPGDFPEVSRAYPDI